MPKRKTQEEVIADFKAQHGNRFDYSRVIYQGAAKKVEVICPAHGAFMITPSHHSRGVGCAKCKADNARISREEFIRRAVEAHGAAYDYSRLKEPFPGVSVKHEIRCVEHDLWFQQEGKAHLVGHTGCSRCRSELLLGPAQMRGKKTSVQEATESFIARAKEVHGETYDYSCAIYRGAGHNIQIICREHGVFTQLPGNHYAGAGCPQCGAARKGAGSFKEKCAELGIDYHRALKRRDAGLPEEKIFRQGFIRTEKVTRTAVTVGGQCFPNIAEACRALQPAASGSTILRWIEDGMSPEEAFSKIPNPGYAAGQIYKVSQVSTGKIYVGLTVMSLEERWKYHQEQAASNRVKSKHSLHYAIRRFGAADFVIEPLDTGTSKADLEGKEIHWIQRLGSMAPMASTSTRAASAEGRTRSPERSMGYDSRAPRPPQTIWRRQGASRSLPPKSGWPMAGSM